MAETSVDKNAAYHGPGLLGELRGTQAKKPNNRVIHCDGISTDRKLDYEDQDI